MLELVALKSQGYPVVVVAQAFDLSTRESEIGGTEFEASLVFYTGNSRKPVLHRGSLSRKPNKQKEPEVEKTLAQETALHANSCL